MFLVWARQFATRFTRHCAGEVTTGPQTLQHQETEECSPGRVGHSDRATENTTPSDHAGMLRMILDSLRRRASLSIASIADLSTTARNAFAQLEDIIAAQWHPEPGSPANRGSLKGVQPCL
jgi:hypothetical protein